MARAAGTSCHKGQDRRDQPMAGWAAFGIQIGDLVEQVDNLSYMAEVAKLHGPNRGVVRPKKRRFRPSRSGCPISRGQRIVVWAGTVKSELRDFTMGELVNVRIQSKRKLI